MMDTQTTKHNYSQAGEASYQAWQQNFLADPENRRIYEEEARQKEIWLQLVEARKSSGLTQKQVAERMGVSQIQVSRIEKRGYEAYTLRTLKRYVHALGAGFSLEVRIAPGNHNLPVV